MVYVGFFSPLHNYSFEVLELICTLSIGPSLTDTFVGINLLKTLVIKGCNTYSKDIQPKYFHGMVSLRTLNLKQNNFSVINSHKSAWTIDLIELDISHNMLTSLGEYAFYGLSSLTSPGVE